MVGGFVGIATLSAEMKGFSESCLDATLADADGYYRTG